MIDRLFIAALTFCLLAGGTLAIGSALFEGGPAAPASQSRPVVQLPPVEVRIVRVVHLPAVEVTGKRTEPGTAMARTDSTEPSTRNTQ